MVVQGPVVGDRTDPPEAQLTRRCLESVRRHLPGAELILSTWHGADTAGFECDYILLNEDPGGVSCTGEKRSLAYNVNRQIVSSANGLRAASQQYAVKVRSDMEFTGTGFLDLFDQFPARVAEWQVFKQRVVGCTIPSQSVRRRGLPLCPSDWFHFGLREDLLTLWDLPLDTGNACAHYFDTHPRPVPDRQPLFRCRYVPEQYIWLGCLSKVNPIPLEHLGDPRPELKRLTELAFANNFILADERQLGVWFRKYRHRPSSTCSYLTHEEWKHLYCTYCAPDYRQNRLRYWADHWTRVVQLVWFRGMGRARRAAAWLWPVAQEGSA